MEKRLFHQADQFELDLGLKQGECPWLYEVSAHIGQSALKDFNVAFERFFEGWKGRGPKSGLPRFKESRSERGFEGRILSATIRRRANRLTTPHPGIDRR